ncbi:armadillo-type protein [Entophlyctis helioformis]|nr:armadillo-type protein [Entophlyctis helioformis]
MRHGRPCAAAAQQSPPLQQLTVWLSVQAHPVSLQQQSPCSMEDQLQFLLKEYFESPSTPPSRKKQIESQLEELKQRPDTVAVCERLLSNPNATSPYTHWFCLTVFEDLLPQWQSRVSESLRKSIREFLWSLVTSSQHRTAFASFVSTKLYKLLVLIARQEYPSEWPDFFDSIVALQQHDEALCLNLLKIAVEEFANVRDQDAIHASRRAHLRAIIESECPRIFRLATQALLRVYDSEIMHNGLPFAETQDASSALPSPGIGIGLMSPLKFTQHLVSSPGTDVLGYSPSKGLPQLPSPVYRNGSGNYERDPSYAMHMTQHAQLSAGGTALCQTALDTIHLLLAWIPLVDPFPVQIVVNTLLKFAQLNNSHVSELGARSIACLNEILARKYAPSSVADFIVLLMGHICELLRFLTSTLDSDGEKLAVTVDEDYRSKVTDLVCHFVTQHSQRAESLAGDFQLPELLRLFFEYTFVQQTAGDFSACMRVWDQFVEIMAATNQAKDASQAALYLSRYQGGIVGLASRLIQRMETATNTKDWTPSEVATVDKMSLDLMIAELYPSDVLQLCFELLSNGGMAIRNALGRKSMAAEQRDVEAVKIASFVFGRISHLFTKQFEATFGASSAVMDQFLSLSELLLDHRQASDQLLSLAGNVLDTVSLYAHWLMLFHQTAQANFEAAASFDALITRLSLITTRFLTFDNDQVRMASSRLLCSLSETVRPDLLKQPAVLQVLSEMHQTALTFPQDAKINLYRFATNLFVLPVLNAKTSEQEWKSRSDMFGQFMQPLLSAYLAVIQSQDMAANSNRPEVRQQISASLDALSGCLLAVRSESTLPKEVVFAALRPEIRPVASLLHLYGNDDAMLCLLLDHISLLFNALRAQMARENMDVVMDTIELFMSMLKGDALVAHLRRPTGSAVVERAIGFLSAAIDHPYKGFSQILPQVIAFCVGEIYPRCIAGTDKAFDGIRPLFFDMLYKLLLNHWRHFFGTRVGAMVGREQSESRNEAEFSAIIQIFVSSFQGQDVEIFKQNMTLLTQLNDKCRLFHKSYFQDHLAVPIVDLLFDILLQRSHDFLRDDIVDFVSRIMVANMDLLQTRIAPQFLSRRHGAHFFAIKVRFLPQHVPANKPRLPIWQPDD